MKETRSTSQILFGYLPDQTVDLDGGVWKVKEWRQPIRETNIDVDGLRREIAKQAMPWRANNKDGGYVTDILDRGFDIKVLRLHKENGVQVEPFPKLWMCKRCNRLSNSLLQKCRCGYEGRPAQLPFVGFHDACGALRSPFLQKCSEHNEVKVVWPGTASAAEIKFVCPTCDRLLRKGFGFPACDCGQGQMTFNVHRAASVYTPRGVVIVNPPSRERIRSIVDAGGPPRALAWVVGGMSTRTMEEVPSTRESLRRLLQQQNLPEEIIERMLSQATPSEALVDVAAEVVLPPERVEDAEAQAVTIALAMSESRQRTSDLADATDPVSELGVLYRDKYRVAMTGAGLESVDLVDKFPVLTGSFGYTRGDPAPGVSRLVPFRERSGGGDYVIYADIANTEAIFLKLDATRVATWLTTRGFALEPFTDARSARISILKAAALPEPGAPVVSDSVGAMVLTLVHSYAHRFLRLAAVHAGIDRNALSELLVPLHLGFFVYAAARGDFVLGGLQAVFESELDVLLRSIIHDEHRCPLDPGCMRSGGACMACLHVGEPSCRYYNRFLNRDVLSGPSGYFEWIARKS